MRISGISPTLYLNTQQNQSKNVSHKGLWGDELQTKPESSQYDGGNMCDMGTDHYLTTKLYFPFLDETKEQIDEVCKKNYKKIESGEGLHTIIDEEVVEVMRTIPVTEAKYNQYIARELLSKEEMEVEDKLKLARMQRFLR